MEIEMTISKDNKKKKNAEKHDLLIFFINKKK